MIASARSTPRWSIDAIGRLHGERLDERVDRLAYHALRDQLRDWAFSYLRQAGQRAAARSAHRESVTLFEQAVSVLGELPETTERLAAGVDVRIAVTTAIVAMRGATTGSRGALSSGA